MIIIPIIVTLVLGIGIGFIPGLNENLHWSLFVFPISGLILGMAAGWLQFMTGYMLHMRYSGWTTAFLGLVGVIAYVGADYGLYWMLTIPITGQEGIPDGDYRLKDLMSFFDYILVPSSTVDGPSVDSTLSLIVDLGGAFLGVIGTHLTLSPKYPYCENCSQFMKRDTLFKVVFKFSEGVVTDIFNKLGALSEQRDYPGLVGYLKEISERYQDKKGEIQITADQRYCEKCRKATILGTVSKRSGRQWSEIEDLAFTYKSEVGEHTKMV